MKIVSTTKLGDSFSNYHVSLKLTGLFLQFIGCVVLQRNRALSRRSLRRNFEPVDGCIATTLCLGSVGINRSIETGDARNAGAGVDKSRGAHVKPFHVE